MIPVVDLFAGPGGLGEGFSAYRSDGQPVFRIALSIEKDPHAHQTLELRSFYRQFSDGDVPDAYYEHLRGEISRDELFTSYPAEAARAAAASWCAELGNEDQFPAGTLDARIRATIGNTSNWVLIGGPPCQAYSIVGRSRMRAFDRRRWEQDPRHYLYRDYLRILAVHQPPAFVMENVKGILSANVRGCRIFDRILADLQEPCRARLGSSRPAHRRDIRYDLYPFVRGREQLLFGDHDMEPSAFVLCSEQHGIPQTRHRVIILGIRRDVGRIPSTLTIRREPVEMLLAIADLPRIRSALSRTPDSPTAWVAAIRGILAPGVLPAAELASGVRAEIKAAVCRLNGMLGTGAEFVRSRSRPALMPTWFFDPRIGGACNHSGRAHIAEDLWRYLFASCFARIYRVSPKMAEFPRTLLPDHHNVGDAVRKRFFADRFRVQVSDFPATTVTSHIAKDGHYFIHPDPTQCRSLTVREAARLQTFPDNYFFCGPRTSQYRQVGNAVPPFLASQLAGVVHDLFRSRCGAG